MPKQYCEAGRVNQLDHFTDEQMDLIENNILPDLDKVLSISEQAIPA